MDIRATTPSGRIACSIGQKAVAWIQMGDWCASSDTKPMKTGARKRHDTRRRGSFANAGHGPGRRGELLSCTGGG